MSVTSNFLEEYTLIVNVSPPEVAAKCKGAMGMIGPAVTHDPALHARSHRRRDCGAREPFPHTHCHEAGQCPGSRRTHNLMTDARSTTTPGGALLFRKDLCHEGLLVQSGASMSRDAAARTHPRPSATAGEKHIVTMNLWATRKQRRVWLRCTLCSGDRCTQCRRDSAKILVVTFPDEGAAEGKGAQTAYSELLRFAQSRSYALSEAEIKQFPPGALRRRTCSRSRLIACHVQVR